MPLLQRCAFAELLCGNMKTHVFYAVHAENGRATVAVPDTPDAVPMPRDLDGEALAREIGTGGAIAIDLDGNRARFPMPPLAGAILARIDGVRSIGEIHRDVSATDAPGIDWRIFAHQFQQVYRVANGLGRMFLRAPKDG